MLAAPRPRGNTADYLRIPIYFADIRIPHRQIRQAAPNLRRYFHEGTPAGKAGMRVKMIGYGRLNDRRGPAEINPINFVTDCPRDRSTLLQTH